MTSLLLTGKLIDAGLLLMDPASGNDYTPQEFEAMPGPKERRRDYLEARNIPIYSRSSSKAAYNLRYRLWYSDLIGVATQMYASNPKTIDGCAQLYKGYSVADLYEICNKNLAGTDGDRSDLEFRVQCIHLGLPFERPNGTYVDRDDFLWNGAEMTPYEYLRKIERWNQDNQDLEYNEQADDTEEADTETAEDGLPDNVQEALFEGQENETPARKSFGLWLIGLFLGGIWWIIDKIFAFIVAMLWPTLKGLIQKCCKMAVCAILVLALFAVLSWASLPAETFKWVLELLLACAWTALGQLFRILWTGLANMAHKLFDNDIVAWFVWAMAPFRRILASVNGWIYPGQLQPTCPPTPSMYCQLVTEGGFANLSSTGI
jgi:hypothetical protein